MNDKVEEYISTSVNDFEISLKLLVSTEPQEAKDIAEQILIRLDGSEGQKTRTALAKRIVRMADKKLMQ